MAQNFPGPCVLTLTYTCTSGGNPLVHVLSLNFDASLATPVGTPFDEIIVAQRDETQTTLDVVTDALVALLKPLFDDAATVFDYAEAFTVEPETFDKTWISAYTIGEAATGTGSIVTGGQQIHTFRTQEGGIMRVDLMESQATPGQAVAYSGLSAANQALVDFFLDEDDAVFLARDTSFPVALLRMLPGRNEAGWKNRYR